VQQNVEAIDGALARLCGAFAERAHGATLSFGLLQPALARIRRLMDETLAGRPGLPPPAPAGSVEAVGSRNPPAGDAGAAARPAALDGPARSFGGHADLRAALGQVIGYFAAAEPSSPALLLVRQARDLIGRSFPEQLAVLMPNHASEAAIRLGGRFTFDLSIDRLVSPDDAAAEAPPRKAAAAAVKALATRGEALHLLGQVAVHVRATEPSSAVPLLCDQARAMAEKDFFALLREVMPAGALRNADDA
jgi:type VI secretion system protein ImpA